MISIRWRLGCFDAIMAAHCGPVLRKLSFIVLMQWQACLRYWLPIPMPPFFLIMCWVSIDSGWRMSWCALKPNYALWQVYCADATGVACTICFRGLFHGARRGDTLRKFVLCPDCPAHKWSSWRCSQDAYESHWTARGPHAVSPEDTQRPAPY